jgi:hypothetical protein
MLHLCKACAEGNHPGNGGHFPASGRKLLKEEDKYGVANLPGGKRKIG